MKQTCSLCGGTGFPIDPLLLRNKRISRKLTLKQVADKMGIAFGYLGDLERGRKPWNAGLQKAFLRALK